MSQGDGLAVKTQTTELLAGLPSDLGDRGTRVEQLVAILTEVVATLPVGGELPSERVVAEHFGVARMTVREAVDKLIARGLAVRIARRGTFAAQPRFIHTRHLASYDEDMASRGMVPGGRKISSRVRKASRTVADSLGIEPGDRYLDLLRLRTADDRPMAVIRSQLALERFPGLEAYDFHVLSLHDVLADGWGVRAATHVQRIRAVALTAHEAELLEVAEGDSAFEIGGESRDADGRVIEIGRSVYRADRYEIVLRNEIP